MTNRSITSLLAALTLAPLPLSAQEAAPALPFSYEMFEAAVAHVDLAACPVDLARPHTFCRVTLINDAFNVFVFSEDGDQPLVAFKSYDAELMTGLFD